MVSLGSLWCSSWCRCSWAEWFDRQRRSLDVTACGLSWPVQTCLNHVLCPTGVGSQANKDLAMQTSMFRACMLCWLVLESCTYDTLQRVWFATCAVCADARSLKRWRPIYPTTSPPAVLQSASSIRGVSLAANNYGMGFVIYHMSEWKRLSCTFAFLCFSWQGRFEV